MVDIQNSPEILDSLRSLLVVHRQDEFQESFVAHLSVDSWVLLEYSVDDDGGKSLRVFRKVFFLEEVVLVGV